MWPQVSHGREGCKRQAGCILRSGLLSPPYARHPTPPSRCPVPRPLPPTTGMHYLHTRRPPIIHGDLRSPNLLLDMTIDNEGPRFHLKVGSK